MTEQRRPLAQCLFQALESSGLTIEELSERTKVPKSTVRAFLGSEEPAVLPQRVYLRGHLGSMARELDVDVGQVLGLFDAQYPSESKIEEAPVTRFHPGTMAVAAGLGGIAIFAVILAFVH